jgi:drug/metabolite transporter (DMT)-like permease
VSDAALALVLASALLHAWWSVSIKGSRDPLLFNALQEVAPLAATLAVLPAIEPGEIPRFVWGLLAATALCHALYFWWMSRAFEHGDLTLVYPIARSTPAFLPLVAVPLLGERLSAGGALGIAIVVAGMWLVHAGGDLRLRALAAPAARYAYLTLATTVGYSLLDKRAMSELAAQPWTSAVPRAAAWNLLLTSASGLLFALLVARRRGVRALAGAARVDLATPTAAAAVSFASYTLVLKALETAPASYVVAVRQTSVLFALLLGVLRLRERPGRPRIVGAVATVVGVALIALVGGR